MIYTQTKEFNRKYEMFITENKRYLGIRNYFLFKKMKKRGDYTEKNYSIYIKKIYENKFYRLSKYIKAKVHLCFYHLKNFKKIEVIGKKKSCEEYFSIVCIIKNEARYIKEWIDFYQLQGANHIYVFDNESTDNVKDLLIDYIKSGIVTYIYYPGKRVQLNAYNDALYQYINKNTKWVGFFDADEYLFSPKNVQVTQVLKEYENIPAIGVNWRVFGPSHHTKRPDGKVVENYLETFTDFNNELNCRIKTIVQLKYARCFISPHFCILKNKYFTLNENKEEIIGDAMYIYGNGLACTLKHSSNILRINHYWTKSIEELKNKCARGYPDGSKNPKFEAILKRLDYPMSIDRSILSNVRSLNKNK